MVAASHDHDNRKEQKPSFIRSQLVQTPRSQFASTVPSMHFPTMIHETFVKRDRATSMENRIPLGCTCVLRDLQAQPTWNGAQVVVLEYVNDEGMFRVQPTDSFSPLPSSLSVRPRNLKPIGRLSPEPGDGNSPLYMETGTVCVLHGLHSKVFNGERVMVLHFIHEESRYQVRPLSPSSSLPPLLAIKPENLILDDHHRVESTAVRPSSRSPFVSFGRGLSEGRIKTESSSVLSVPLPPMQPIQEMQRRQASSRLPMSRFVGKSVSVSALQPYQSSKPMPPPPSRRFVGKSVSSSALQPFQPERASNHREGPLSRFSGIHQAPFHPSPPIRTSSQTNQLMHRSCSTLDCDLMDPQLMSCGRGVELSRMGSVPVLRSTSASSSLFGGRSLLSRGDNGSQNQNGIARAQSLRGPDLVRIPSMRMRSTDSERQLSVNEGSDRMLHLPKRRPSFTKTTSVSDLPESSGSLGSDAFGEPDLMPGSKAQLMGLQAQASLNGKDVLIQECVEVHGQLRYRVRLLDDDVTVSSHDLVIHRRNLKSISELDSGSFHDGKYRQGDRLRLTGLVSRPHMNGHLVEVIEYVKGPRRYLVLPADIEASDACDMEIMSVAVENLVPETPCWAGNKDLSGGSRVVLDQVPGKPTLNGELAVIVQHQPDSLYYRVRLLGETAMGKHNGGSLLVVPSRAVKAVQATSMWVNMVVQGKPCRVPSVCQVEDGRLVVRLDAFPGIDCVVPIAKVLMGEDSCDWMHDGEVLDLLREHPSSPLSCTVVPESNEVMVDPSVQSRNPFFKAMVEYELLKLTTKVLHDSEPGNTSVFQALFPIAKMDSLSHQTDDENPFQCPGETPEKDENPFHRSKMPQASEAVTVESDNGPNSPEPPTSKALTVDYTLVEEALSHLLSKKPGGFGISSSLYQEHSPREGHSPKPDPPGRHEDPRILAGEMVSIDDSRLRSSSRDRGSDPDTSSTSSSLDSSLEGKGRLRSKDKEKKKKKKKKDKSEKKNRTKSRSTSRSRRRASPASVALVSV